ncbi:MAG: hypothetical protein RSB95_04925 [Bacilli bacterium]
MNNLSFYNDLFNALLSNVRTESILHYNIFLDTSSLFGIDKYIYDRVKTILNDPTINEPTNPNFFHKDFLSSLISVDVPIRQE